MLTVAYYTRYTAYEVEAEILRRSLCKAEMPHYMRAIDDPGGWYPATAYKAEFLREQRETQGGPLLYIDVDAYVHENCEAYFERLAEQGHDVGFHYGVGKGHNREKLMAAPPRLLSGTIFLNDTPKCREMLTAWCELNKALQGVGIMRGGGQKNLWYLTTCMEGLKIAELPGRYCYVFDKPWAYPTDEPVIIEHTIASRDHRAKERQTPERKKRIAELKGLLP